MTQQCEILCQRLKRLGFAQENQVRLYGEEFELVSDPIVIADRLCYPAPHRESLRNPCTLRNPSIGAIERRPAQCSLVEF